MAQPAARSAVRRLAHRGDWRHAPENSLPALLAGAAAPCSDGIEFDVHLAADGTPVLTHDSDLLRVQGVPGAVASMDAGTLAGLGVPSLAAVLAALPAEAFLDVELKVVPNQACADLLIASRGPAPLDAVVSSFDAAVLRVAAHLLPGWPRWLNVHALDAGDSDRARSLGAVGLAAEWWAITPSSAAAVRAAGLVLVAWTVRRRPTLERLERLGVAVACVEGGLLDR